MKIAIDGPCAAGKTTTAKRLANDMGIAYIDTGSMFRAIALFCKLHGISYEDAKARMDDIRSGVSFTVHDNAIIMYVDGFNEVREEQEIAMRSSEIAQDASMLSQQKCIRDFVLEMEQSVDNYCENFIMEGRDICSVVLPDAELKFYMTADAFARARRRMYDLQQKGEFPSEQEVYDQLMKRDTQDLTRKEAPLMRTSDSILIDNTNLSFEETVAMLETLIRKRWHREIEKLFL